MVLSILWCPRVRLQLQYVLAGRPRVCREHYRAAVERLVNLLPVLWLLHPQIGGVFDSLDHCNRRLRGLVLAEGFEIVCKEGDTKANPSWRLFCLHHGAETPELKACEAAIRREMIQG